MIYFTADTHFFSKKQCRHIGAEVFETAAARVDALMTRWNETVGAGDEIYILGDFSDGTAAETAALLLRLNGTKYLIRGNNDLFLEDENFNAAAYFVWCKDYFELHTLGTKFDLLHYPMEAWSGYKNDRVHLHGHLHSMVPMRAALRKYEVGVDANGGAPVDLETVWHRVEPFHNPSVYRG